MDGHQWNVQDTPTTWLCKSHHGISKWGAAVWSLEEEWIGMHTEHSGARCLHTPEQHLYRVVLMARDYHCLTQQHPTRLTRGAWWWSWTRSSSPLTPDFFFCLTYIVILSYSIIFNCHFNFTADKLERRETMSEVTIKYFKWQDSSQKDGMTKQSPNLNLQTSPCLLPLWIWIKNRSSGAVWSCVTGQRGDPLQSHQRAHAHSESESIKLKSTGKKTNKWTQGESEKPPKHFS